MALYTPDHFSVDEREALLSFIDDYPFATLLSHAGSESQITHVPMSLERRDDGDWISGHMARANPQWRGFDGKRAVVALFHGPHAYISPSWYARNPAVPTWNYAVVHVHGRPRLCEEGSAGRLLDALTDRFEAGMAAPWSSASLPEKFRSGLERRIVAFEFAIEGLEGKWKLGQNGSDEDRAGTLAGLEATGDAGALALATFTRDCFGEQRAKGGKD